MSRRLTPTLLASLVGLALLSGCQNLPSQSNTETAVTNQAQVNAEDARLQGLIEQEWQLRMSYSPFLAQRMGDESAAAKLSDMSPETLAKQDSDYRAFLAELDGVAVDALSDEMKINHQILRAQVQEQLDSYQFNTHYTPITAEGGFHSYLPQIANARFDDEQDYQNYLARLAQVPKLFEQQTYWLKQGLASGDTPPQVVLNGFEDSISAYITDVEQSSFYKPFKTFPEHFSAEQKQSLAQQGLAAVAEHVLPAYQGFYDFMTQEYMPGARQSIAAAELPNGKAFYENRVKYYTTLDMTPDEVHQLGLNEVARIRAEMQEIIDEVEFDGDFAAFLEFLRTDPQFYPKTEQELLRYAAWIAKRADAMLPSLFGKLPRTPYGIKEVPKEIAPKYTTGRYSGSSRPDQPGYYWVNTYALDKRPLYEMEALTLHEGVPGHHLQIALNQELDNLPNFRRYSYISAFGEGWGLYAEYLGLEGGFYKDPYSNFGRLTYEMWRAARLVVDTGMHYKGWSRDKALDFMASNTALSLHNVTTEIDRYISWPGQALSYKIGELTIKRLRAKAEAELGQDFDVRRFHDAVLANGSVPLSVLEGQIDLFIEAEKKALASAS
ncbi:DUF885 domain-containing protein [Paraferrimonas sedimenticola]|uniref:DUF885 domain-containing protein n=1 Tax=Paraferrimonas sedimenticola TaxID=375674 RepID=A0AA37RZ19_9GAMM|nr:DUF885 domain-containing protein [Paraferrimonas sedimenticola]GLP97808.1 hypothetical protein GCM10007895_31150 [Paraferrimonas sedimenticola]